ncbi:MAG: hypothetical protein M0Q19_05120 [Candidatus Cloacimonetes bacterium]|nr:hypothetical protein [Candidatus Cloacimonadota bacterium]MCK9332544.1 hypothetical protein [Candidatus Cloacimonadota bacterium]
MEINTIITTIETKFSDLGVDAQATLLEVSEDLILTIGCVIDPSLLTYSILEGVKAFNDDATTWINFHGGKIITVGDAPLFMLMFSANQCNGGL